jgi:hypothetical protein
MGSENLARLARHVLPAALPRGTAPATAIPRAGTASAQVVTTATTVVRLRRRWGGGDHQVPGGDDQDSGTGGQGGDDAQSGTG